MRAAGYPRGSARSSDEWYTPREFVAAFGAFDLDPCAGPMRHATRNLRANGLRRTWRGRVWLNPPYSDLFPWIDRMIEHRHGLLLVNARTETAWFQRALAAAEAVLFPARRIRFISPSGARGNPPAGQAVLAFCAEDVRALEGCSLPGTILYRHKEIL